MTEHLATLALGALAAASMPEAWLLMRGWVR